MLVLMLEVQKGVMVLLILVFIQFSQLFTYPRPKGSDNRRYTVSVIPVCYLYVILSPHSSSCYCSKCNQCNQNNMTKK